MLFLVVNKLVNYTELKRKNNQHSFAECMIEKL